ncbi:VWA domain-containing protein [uncultured Paludibaculum sp.]|uniref:VWA domain-containing protein n=1 Tax=uncultured Paludibaculum sp. TaxID=1765020 RepID=UPI002AABC419|nr:VWA domain-containing protein [uncultured Paludibaculum sp.]
MQYRRAAVPLLVCTLAFGWQPDAPFRSNVPLVVAPVTVVDRKGRPVENLSAADFILTDKGEPQRVNLDEIRAPISLVLVVQTSFQPMLDKLRGLGNMIGPMVMGQDGEVALITFGREVSVDQPFTPHAAVIAHKLTQLQAWGKGASTVDAVLRATELLAQAAPSRRRVILLISEDTDRSSRAKPGEALFQVAQHNISLYAMTFSRFLMPFTVKPADDLPPGALKGESGCQKPPPERTAPITERPFADKVPTLPPKPLQSDCNKADLLALFGELKRATAPHPASLLSAYTGGSADGVLRKNAMERALEAIGSELHTQYVLTFTPPAAAEIEFHNVKVVIRGRPDLTVRTRAGYWSIPR